MKLSYQKIAVTTALGMTLLPIIALGQGSGVVNPVNPPNKDFTFADVIKWLNTLVTWMFTIFLIIAVVYGLLAAFNYLFSGGDEEKVKTAQRYIIYVAVAIGVALLSVALRYLVQNFLGVQPV